MIHSASDVDILHQSEIITSSSVFVLQMVARLPI